MKMHRKGTSDKFSTEKYVAAAANVSILIILVSLTLIELGASAWKDSSELKLARAYFTQWVFLQRVPPYTYDSVYRKLCRSEDTLEGVGHTVVGLTTNGSIASQCGAALGSPGFASSSTLRVTPFRCEVPFIQTPLFYRIEHPSAWFVPFSVRWEFDYIIARGTKPKKSGGVDWEKALASTVRNSSLSREVQIDWGRIWIFDSITKTNYSTFRDRYKNQKSPNQTAPQRRFVNTCEGFYRLVCDWLRQNPEVLDDSTFIAAWQSFIDQADDAEADLYRCVTIERQRDLDSRWLASMSELPNSSPSTVMGEHERRFESKDVTLQMMSLTVDRGSAMFLLCILNTIFIILVRSLVRVISVDSDSAIAEPWFLLDCRGFTEKSVAVCWEALLFLGPLVGTVAGISVVWTKFTLYTDSSKTEFGIEGVLLLMFAILSVTSAWGALRIIHSLRAGRTAQRARIATHQEIETI
jgi:hypothetical protein